MKRIIVWFMMAVLLTGLCFVSVSAAGTGSLSAGSASGYRGDTVSVSVNLSSNPGLITMKLQVSYSDNLTLVSVNNSGLLNGWTNPSPTISSPYTLRWADSLATENNTATGKLLTLTFKIADDADFGTETVSIIFSESRDALGGKNSFNGTSASITVKCQHSYGQWSKVDDTHHSKTCAVCQDVQTATHTRDNGITLKPASCKEGGRVQYTCTTCSATNIEDTDKTNDHSYGNWSKVNNTSHSRTCSVCQDVQTDSHFWDNGTIIKSPNCKEGGQMEHTCAFCPATSIEELDKLTTHTYDHSCDNDCNVCGLTRTTTHSYKTAWSKDKNQHWYECSACKDKKDAVAHTPGPEATEAKAQTCTVCGYVIKAALSHTHKYADSWTTDGAGHWYVCSGCEEKGSYADHDFENVCDPDCSVCGFTRDTKHIFEEKWTADADNHWHICTGCGLKQDEAAHEPGAAATATTAQVCTICEYEIAPALGVEDTEPKATEPAGQEPIAEEPFPWRIVIIAVVVAAGVVVFIVVRKKKN